MVTKIQISVMLVALCTFFVTHHSASPIMPSTTPVEQSVQKNDFFGKQAEFFLPFGIKAWAKVDKKVIQNRWALGGEIAIGPVMEWHPLNGIGIQIGLLYSYNAFFTVCFSLDRKRFLDTSLSSFGTRVLNAINALSAKGEGYIAHGGLEHIAFHAINIPLFFELYPEKSLRLVCYGGPRFLLTLSNLAIKEFCPVYIDTSNIKKILFEALDRAKNLDPDSSTTLDDITNIAEDGLLQIYRCIFNLNVHPHYHPYPGQNQLLHKKQRYWDIVWDFGLEFRAKSGFVIGMNGLGVVLGYRYVR